MICQEPVQCSNFDYVRLQKRLDQSSLPSAPTSKSSQQKVENFSTQQDLQIVPNHFDHEDEPSVLTATPCLPTKPPEKVLPEPKPETDSGNLTKPAPTHLLKGSVFFLWKCSDKKNIILNFIKVAWITWSLVLVKQICCCCCCCFWWKNWWWFNR